MRVMSLKVSSHPSGVCSILRAVGVRCAFGVSVVGTGVGVGIEGAGFVSGTRAGEWMGAGSGSGRGDESGLWVGEVCLSRFTGSKGVNHPPLLLVDPLCELCLGLPD